MTEPTVTPLAQTIELRVTGQPDVPNQYGSGHIRPTEITFRYQTDSIRAQVYGRWIREDGELTDAPITRDYTTYQGDMSDWPGWVAELAREHAPAGQQPRRGDAFEAWLKAQRDKYDRTDQREESSEFWHEFDGALDLYRLHADMGVPLDGHVCEARVVGDCECLEPGVS